MSSGQVSERRRRSRLRRLAVFLLINSVFTAVLVVIALFYGWTSVARGLPELQGWHLDWPPSDFREEDLTPGYSFDDYLAQEDQAFAELAALVQGPWAGEAPERLSRFRAGSRSDPASLLDRNWNRSFVLEAERPVGGALLLHGLSDAPYSLRAIGHRLHDEGYTVIWMRVPGHGLSPAALTEIEWEDWAAAVRVAMVGLLAKVPAPAPLVMVGYSNGGALSVDYTIASLRDASMPRPAALALFSPMIGVNPMAKMTTLYPWVARISGQKKVAWAHLDAEIDPYKYSSWPMNASLQAWRMTQRVESDLAEQQKRGGMGEFPPVITIQSAVDATVKAPLLIERLFDRLPANGSELVLFDINRKALLGDLLRLKFEDALRQRLARQDPAFSVTLITNASEDTTDLLARRWSGGEQSETPIDLQWPKDVYSLSHLAMPIPSEDPVYGTAEATEGTGLPLGSLSLRGESGVLAISDGSLLRQRYNPFYKHTENLIIDWLSRTIGAPAPDAAE